MTDQERVILRFDPQSRYINFYLRETWIYDIALDDFRDSIRALEWIRQLSEKTWAAKQTISEICSLVIRLLKAEGKLNQWGQTE
jgi:hypothetical protein